MSNDSTEKVTHPKWTCVTLLSHLASKGITLTIEDEKFGANYEDDISDEDDALIREHKDALKAFLLSIKTPTIEDIALPEHPTPRQQRLIDSQSPDLLQYVDWEYVATFG